MKKLYYRKKRKKKKYKKSISETPCIVKSVITIMKKTQKKIFFTQHKRQKNVMNLKRYYTINEYVKKNNEKSERKGEREREKKK